MSIYIKNPAVDSLARALAKREGVSVTRMVGMALEKHAEKMPKRPKHNPSKKRAAAMKILREIWKMPVVDHRSADEILGFNKHGVFD